jgi:hypothetical protein
MPVYCELYYGKLAVGLLKRCQIELGYVSGVIYWRVVVKYIIRLDVILAYEIPLVITFYKTKTLYGYLGYL